MYRIFSRNILSGSYEWDEHIFQTKAEAASFALKAKMQSVFIIPDQDAIPMMNQMRGQINRQIKQQMQQPTQFVETIDERHKDDGIDLEEKKKWPWLPKAKKFGPDKIPLVKPAVVGRRKK